MIYRVYRYDNGRLHLVGGYKMNLDEVLNRISYLKSLGKYKNTQLLITEYFEGKSKIIEII